MEEPFVLDNNLFLNIKNWQKLNSRLCVGFTTKNGGVSSEPFATLNCGLHVEDDSQKVVENRELIANELSFPMQNWVSGEQVHGTRVMVVDDKDKGKGAATFETSVKKTDGIITTQKGILCTAFFADCVPLFFYDPKKEIVGIAHAGWKGTVKNIAGNMVKAFQKLGSNPTDLLVAIGPSISQTNYEVDNSVFEHIDENYREKVTIRVNIGRYLADLKQLNVENLLQHGVLRNNIEVTNYCTFANEDLFFSHRRDEGKTGRMLGFIGFL